MRLTLPEIKKKVNSIVPDDISFDVSLEAGSISIITHNPKEFSRCGEILTVKIAKSI